MARRDQRRLQGVDRQELRLPDRGLEDHAHPRAQRGLPALPGLALSPPARARKRSLRGPDGGAERQPVRRRRFLFAEFCRAGPCRGGDPRQQSLASGGVGARARHGRRAAGAAGRYRAQGASSLAAARRDAVQADAAAAGPQGRTQPQARHAGREHPARPDRGIQTRSGAQPGHLPCRYPPDAAHQGYRQPDPGRTGRDRAVARRGLDRLRSDDLATGERRCDSFRRARRPRRKSIIWRSSRPFSTRCPAAPATDIDVSFVGTVSPDHRQRIALLEAVAERYDLKLFGKPAAGAARLLAAASLLSGRSLGRRHVSGAAALEDHAQLAYRHGRPGSRKHAAVRGDRRRRFPADRFQGQSAHAVRAGSRSRGMALDRRLPRRHRPRISATTRAARRSRAPARRGPWRSIPIAIAPPRSWASSTDCGARR